MTAKETIDKIKGLFNLPVGAPAVVPPVVAPAAPAKLSTDVPYTLQDGTQISVSQAGDAPAIGDTVTIAGAPAPAGSLTLDSGIVLTVDATGIITQVTPAVAAPAAAVAPPVVAPAVPLTQAQMMEIATKFAGGSPEERLSNLEVLAKALMENQFGWQIDEVERIASTNAAIEVYKTTFAAQDKKINEQDEKIKLLLQLCEQLTELPTVSPITLTGNKKDRFEKENKKEQTIMGIADAITQIQKAKSN